MTQMIPVRASGGRLVSALVDDADFARLAQFRWRLLPSGHVVRRQRQGTGPRRYYYLHREVVGASHGDDLRVEHDNGNKLDNRRGNLSIRPSAPSRSRALVAVAKSVPPDIAERTS